VRNGAHDAVPEGQESVDESILSVGAAAAALMAFSASDSGNAFRVGAIAEACQGCAFKGTEACGSEWEVGRDIAEVGRGL